MNLELEVGRFLTDVARFAHIVPARRARWSTAPTTAASYTRGAAAGLRHEPGRRLGLHRSNYLERFLEDRQHRRSVRRGRARRVPRARRRARRHAPRNCTPRCSRPRSDAGVRARADRRGGSARAGAQRVRRERPKRPCGCSRASEIAADSVRAARDALLDARAALGATDRCARRARGRGSASKQRHHGDFHLGQVLVRAQRLPHRRLRGRAGTAAVGAPREVLRRCATWRGCCARSRTRAVRRSRTARARPARRVPRAKRGSRAGRRATRAAFLAAYETPAREAGLMEALAPRLPAAAAVRDREGAVRAALRAAQPARLGRAAAQRSARDSDVSRHAR